MITPDTTVLYFGNDWYAENRTSSHHIARCLAKRCNVIYIECPGLRSPKGNSRDIRRVGQKLLRFLRGARRVKEGLRVKTLLQVPLHRFAIIRQFNRHLLRWTIRLMILRFRIKSPVTWFVVPHVSSLAGRLNESLTVYYCIDDYAALPDVDFAAVTAMDQELTANSNLVFVASETLLAAKKALNLNTFLSPHGVDVAHFGKAQSDNVVAPPELDGIPRPIIGFFGLIEQWIDLETVRYLAENRPDWSFVMIGRVAVDREKIPKLPNLHFLGQRPYEQLPDYGGHFAASIIPYYLTRQVMHANPLKLREYLAMGKPVVSSRTPETEKFGDVVAIADSPEEFLAAIDRAVQERDDTAAVKKRLERVASFSWQARVDEVLNQISEQSRHVQPSSRIALTER